MKKQKVLHMGGLYRSKNNQKWGGTRATSKYLYLAFKNDPEFDINFVDRSSLQAGKTWNLKKIKALVKDADIVHVDGNGLCDFIFKNKIKIDVIGPITRAPKTVKAYNANWNPSYTEEWFYSHKIIRLSISEERNSKHVDAIHIVDHGVPTTSTVLLPKKNCRKQYILWAGDKKRYAKNYPLMEEIIRTTTLPLGYTFKMLSGYNVEDYWKLLDETAVVINTSRWETFCCAMFEAKAKGVPVIYKKNLHSGRFLDNRLQVEYNAKAYSKALLDLLSDKDTLQRESVLSREYALENASLEKMRDSWARIYNEV